MKTRNQRMPALVALSALLVAAPASALSPGGQSLGEVASLEDVADELAAELASKGSKMSGHGALAVGLESETRNDEVFFSILTGLLSERLLRKGVFTDVVEVAHGREGRQEARLIGAKAHLDAHLVRGDEHLSLAGVLSSTWVNFWTGEVHGPEPMLVSLDLDLDSTAWRILDSGGSPRSGGALELTEVAHLAGSPVACAVGDLTGDGRSEIVVLLDEELVVLARDVNGKAEEIARRDLLERPRALVTSRDPTGGVGITHIGDRPVIVYHHSRVLEGEVLSLELDGFLRPLTAVEEHPIASAADGTIVYGRLVRGTNLFSGPLRLTGPRGGKHLDLDGPIFAADIAPEGDTVVVVNDRFRLLAFEQGELEATSSSVPVGATIALARLGSDDRLLRVGSAGSLPSEEDRLVVFDPEGNVLEIRPVRGSIRAMASGDVTGRGRDEVVVVSHTGEEVVVLLLAEGAR